MARDRRDKETLDLVEYFEAHAKDWVTKPKRLFKQWAIKLGPLSQDEIELICDLAETGMKSWSIAQKMERHPSSIAWQMWKFGFKPISRAPKKNYLRGGKLITTFSEDEDRFILDRRIAGDTPTEIARQHCEMFPNLPHPRSRDTIASRLIMLASDEAVRDVA